VDFRLLAREGKPSCVSTDEADAATEPRQSESDRPPDAAARPVTSATFPEEDAMGAQALCQGSSSTVVASVGATRMAQADYSPQGVGCRSHHVEGESGALCDLEKVLRAV